MTVYVHSSSLTTHTIPAPTGLSTVPCTSTVLPHATQRINAKVNLREKATLEFWTLESRLRLRFTRHNSTKAHAQVGEWNDMIIMGAHGSGSNDARAEAAAEAEAAHHEALIIVPLIIVPL